MAPDLPSPPEALASYRGSGTVLVVDDEQSIRAAAANILEHIGFHALHASDGLEALDLLRLHAAEVRLVIMDLTMPNLDGEEAYRAMREEGFTVPGGPPAASTRARRCTGSWARGWRASCRSRTERRS